MKWPLVIASLMLLLGLLQCSKMDPVSGYSDAPVGVLGGGIPVVEARDSTMTVTAGSSLSRLKSSVNIKSDMVRRGTHGRKVVRPMRPRYITIHSTQNYTADAERHALALKRGALRAPKRRGGNRIGYLIWHYTVDEDAAVQHMPTSEQGEHADFDGPGNRYSIGVEMCENRGASLSQTIDRTARLTAYLMHKNGIPISNVVPHYHWERRGTSRPHKNCPHFLMDNGHPGRKWKAFQTKVNRYYRSVQAQSMASR